MTKIQHQFLLLVYWFLVFVCLLFLGDWDLVIKKEFI